MSQRDYRQNGNQANQTLGTLTENILASIPKKKKQSSEITGSTLTPKPKQNSKNVTKSIGISLSETGVQGQLSSTKTPRNFLTIAKAENTAKVPKTKSKNLMQSLVDETKFTDIKDMSAPELIVRLEKIDDAIHELVSFQPATDNQLSASLQGLADALGINLPEIKTLFHLKETLIIYPPRMLSVAFAHVKNTYKYPSFPKPADFLEAINESSASELALLNNLQRRKSVVEMALKNKGIDTLDFQTS